MENLTYKTTEAFAVIDRNNNLIDILDDFDDSLDAADYYGASCIETLENYDGYSGDVVDTYWISETREPNMMKQKIYALLMIIMSVITVPILDGDATFAVFMIPIMVCMFFSKQYWIID